MLSLYLPLQVDAKTKCQNGKSISRKMAHLLFVCQSDSSRSPAHPLSLFLADATHVDCPRRDNASCPSHTHTHAHRQTDTRTVGSCAGCALFKDISKCDASVFYFAQIERDKCDYVCVCVHFALLERLHSRLAANSFCQFHVRNYKLSGQKFHFSYPSCTPPLLAGTWYNCRSAPLSV